MSRLVRVGSYYIPPPVPGTVAASDDAIDACASLIQGIYILDVYDNMSVHLSLAGYLFVPMCHFRICV